MSVGLKRFLVGLGGAPVVAFRLVFTKVELEGRWIGVGEFIRLGAATGSLVEWFAVWPPGIRRR